MYAEEKHAQCLIKFLEKSTSLCRGCPADIYLFNEVGKSMAEMSEGEWNWINRTKTEECCDICDNFIPKEGRSYLWKCACLKFGPRIALEKSWVMLEEKGYLD